MEIKVKKITALTILMLIVALTLGACVNTPSEHEHTFLKEWTSNETHHWHKASCGHTSMISGQAAHKFVNNKCEICGYEKTSTPNTKPGNTPPSSKTAEEVIAQYVSALVDEKNFTISANMLIPASQASKYQAFVDGNKIHANGNDADYYLEEKDGVVYAYVQDDDKAWHKSVATEDFTYPTDIEETLISLLENVEWKEYNEKTGVAKGYVSVEDYDYILSNFDIPTQLVTHLEIEFIMQEEVAEINLSGAKYFEVVDKYIPVIPIAKATIYNIGTTTVTLPENIIDDTATVEPETPTDNNQEF